MLQTTIAVKKPEQREILLGKALTEISDGDPLLKYYVDTTTHEIILSFLGMCRWKSFVPSLRKNIMWRQK